jgi:hypothetical protein
MRADRHLDADIAEYAVAVLQPSAQCACDHREHGVVDRRSRQGVRGIVQARQRGGGERDGAPMADVGVERGAVQPGKQLATDHPGVVVGSERGVWVRVVAGGGCLGLGVPEHLAGESHQGRPVGQRVVNLPHEHRVAVGERADQVDSPERAVAVQALEEQPGDLSVQGGVVQDDAGEL